MNSLTKIFKLIINKFNKNYVAEIVLLTIKSVQFNPPMPYTFPPT